ncbi:hypothetical protein HAX54_014782, partial [Datura stramonium]|nr:hypothetical protein [Datura stramonium]
ENNDNSFITATHLATFFEFFLGLRKIDSPMSSEDHGSTKLHDSSGEVLNDTTGEAYTMLTIDTVLTNETSPKALIYVHNKTSRVADTDEHLTSDSDDSCAQENHLNEKHSVEMM